VVLPELLRGVLSGDPGEDLLSTWVVILELGQVVDILINDDEQVAGRVMRRNIGGGEGFRHFVVVCRNRYKSIKKSLSSNEGKCIREQRAV
jgi:hypothetical protein